MTATTEPLLKSLVGIPSTHDYAGIYQIALMGTTRSYIGRSLSAGERLRDHAVQLTKRRHQNHKLQSAWNEYGEDRFSYKLLEKVGGKKIVAREQFWIDHFQSALVGFNIAQVAGPLQIDSEVKLYRNAKQDVKYALRQAQFSRSAIEQDRRLLGKTECQNLYCDIANCIWTNYHAVTLLNQVPAGMVDGTIRECLDIALLTTNEMIEIYHRGTGETPFLPHVVADPKTFSLQSMPLSLEYNRLSKLRVDLAALDQPWKPADVFKRVGPRAWYDMVCAHSGMGLSAAPGITLSSVR
jgi:group I intron endonuclease